MVWSPFLSVTSKRTSATLISAGSAREGTAAAWWAAERLTEALGEPLPFCRPLMTATVVGHLVCAGLLVYLGGDIATPDVYPDQVDALARRRNLPLLPDRHVPLGPDQAPPIASSYAAPTSTTSSASAGSPPPAR